MYDYTIIGGGIVGLASLVALQEAFPHAKIALIEKEAEVARHQTGHNSGVIHSGIYYRPGSFKARFAREGNRSMVEFCHQNGVPYEQCGKVIVATNEKELPALKQLYERGRQNRLPIRLLNQEELQEREPYVRGIKAIEVESAGIVDYKEVSRTFLSIAMKKGVDCYFDEEVVHIDERHDGMTIETNQQTVKSKMLINCAGLYSDKVANMAGYLLDVQIIPFRGEYYKLKEEKKHYVKDLIYPVPNLHFPFLGVHFTRMMDGSVEAGPNAVLSFRREGYQLTDWDAAEWSETLRFPGFWKLASRYIKEGADEMYRSVSKRAFVRRLQELIPAVTEEDVEKAPAGVRAQALTRDGKLMDDFYIIGGNKSVHVINAPSPAATSAIPIGQEVVRQIKNRL
ncbi:L-2-hydroxyglutarate oxidase [Aliibacillus thermotolerans]|uniref:L-2-hydroxyglutarate oxidase n=1 Tax=Aliibacillus thermotolerans TaxID=1834418 RepID=A0ABW0UAJ9_9BACI|nr:L-2-hydroxyglutarate oxidase [Aliibacillus thermotolerans]MDA3130226.1 L-2-hydroxyglutarate oxidase [Aliibacillus thermotolerans]